MRCISSINVNKLTNQLTREFKKNPGKAAALGGLLLVAVWFWYPLVKKWTGGSDAVAKPQVVAPVAEHSSVAVAAETTPVASSVGPQDWRAITQTIDEDSWMKPGTLKSDSFDPFYPEQEINTMLTSIDQPEKPEPIDLLPTAAGLVVTSVIIGNSDPIARINNQNYHLGDLISGTSENVRYRLVGVRSWGVLLQGSRQVHELHIDDSPPTGSQKFVLRNGNLISTGN